MYTLFYSPGACSMAIHVALNECGQQVKLEKVDLQATRSPEFLKYNPRGSVPVLLDGEKAIREGAAILIHVLEKHDSPLLPKSGDARTDALQWLMYANSSLHPSYSRTFFLLKNKAPEELLDTSFGMVNKMWAEIEERLSSNKFLCGDQITIADILITVIANWSASMPKISIGPNTKKLFKTVTSRPAYQKALELENVQYKMAA